jgi:hypothetical protein
MHDVASVTICIARRQFGQTLESDTQTTLVASEYRASV